MFQAHCHRYQCCISCYSLISFTVSGLFINPKMESALFELAHLQFGWNTSGDKSEGMGVLISGSNSSIRRRGNGFALFTGELLPLHLNIRTSKTNHRDLNIYLLCFERQLTVAAHQQSYRPLSFWSHR